MLRILVQGGELCNTFAKVFPAVGVLSSQDAVSRPAARRVKSEIFSASLLRARGGAAVDCLLAALRRLSWRDEAQVLG